MRVAGVTLRGAEFAGAALIELEALGESAGWEFAGGGAFRAIRSVEPRCSGLASGIADGLSERDPAVVGAGAFTVGVRKVFAAGGVEVSEVVSLGRLGSAGDVASTASGDF